MVTTAMKAVKRASREGRSWNRGVTGIYMFNLLPLISVFPCQSTTLFETRHLHKVDHSLALSDLVVAWILGELEATDVLPIAYIYTEKASNQA